MTRSTNYQVATTWPILSILHKYQGQHLLPIYIIYYWNFTTFRINVPAAVFKGFEEPRAVATPPARPVRPHTSPSIPAPIDKDGWVVTKVMKTKFDAVFQSLKPVNGKLSGQSDNPNHHVGTRIHEPMFNSIFSYYAYRIIYSLDYSRLTVLIQF